MYFEDFQAAFRAAILPEDRRVAVGDRFEAREECETEAVRRSFAAFTVVMRPPCHTFLLLSPRAGFSRRGAKDALRAEAVVPGLRAEMRLVGYVPGDDGKLLPDPVESGDEAELEPLRNVQMRLHIDIPADAKPGLYEGKVIFRRHWMFEEEKPVKELAFRVRVRDTVLPEKGAFLLNLWQHPSRVARQCETPLFSDAHFEALDSYARALGALGNRYATVIVSDIPWCGQRAYLEAEEGANLYEYNFARVFREADGAFSYDFTNIRRWYDIMARYGADRIMLTGMFGVWKDDANGFGNITEDWPDAVRVSYVDRADGSVRYLTRSADLLAYFRALRDYLRDEGLLEICVVMADEVDRGEVAGEWNAAWRRIDEAAPGFRYEWDVPPSVILSEKFAGMPVDTYTPSIEEFCEEQDLLAAVREKVTGPVLWSVCCWPALPNSFLLSPLAETRFHGALTEMLHMDGFLRWNFVAWSRDPRADMRLMRGFWPAGDALFAYPSRGGECLPSLRYWALRRGIEDFELMQMLKKKRPDTADAVISEALANVVYEPDIRLWNYGDWEHEGRFFALDGEPYERMRRALTDALEA